jgi:hypothetical protein
MTYIVPILLNHEKFWKVVDPTLELNWAHLLEIATLFAIALHYNQARG